MLVSICNVIQLKFRKPLHFSSCDFHFCIRYRSKNRLDNDDDIGAICHVKCKKYKTNIIVKLYFSRYYYTDAFSMFELDIQSNTSTSTQMCLWTWCIIHHEKQFLVSRKLRYVNINLYAIYNIAAARQKKKCYCCRAPSERIE